MLISDIEKIFSPPKSYFIELTNRCNLTCTMCNFHSPVERTDKHRAKGFMDINLAKGLIEQIAGLGEPAWVALHGAGESLLHKDLIEIIRFGSSFKNLKIGLLTNGMLLSPEMSRGIIDARISWIGFSIDGTNKEKFEKYRRGSDYDLVLKNVLGFLSLKEMLSADISTMVNMTAQLEMEADIEGFVTFWIDKVNEVLISPCRPVGSRESKLIDKSSPRIPCYMLYDMMVIFWDGKVALCCEDWYNEGMVGDATRDNITDIWNGREFSRLRMLHEEGRYHEIPLCSDCSSWYNAINEEYFDETLKLNVRKNAWQYTYRRSLSQTLG